MRILVLQDFNRNIFSSGTVVLNAAVRGTPTAPLVNGRVELKNASFNLIDMPNGISNANGVVTFNGNNAVMRNVTAESGGGKVTLDGFTTMDGTIRFGLRANASNIRRRGNAPTGGGRTTQQHSDHRRPRSPWHANPHEMLLNIGSCQL